MSVVGHDVGRADAAVQERQLPEVSAGVEPRDLLLPHPARGRPVEHEEELPARLAVRGEDGALLDADRASRAGRWRGARPACRSENSGTAPRSSICFLGIRLRMWTASVRLCTAWVRRPERTAPPPAPGPSTSRRSESPPCPQALAQHELLHLARGRARQLVDDAELLGPLLAGQARRWQVGPHGLEVGGLAARAACGRRRTRARRAARRARPPRPPRPRPSCGPGAAPPRPR